MVNECWGCRFFIRYGKRDAGGECHKYAPHAAMVKVEDPNRAPVTEYRVCWPIMDSGDGCGEWAHGGTSTDGEPLSQF